MHPGDRFEVYQGEGRRPTARASQAPSGDRDPAPLLSERQSRILALIAAGNTTREIAAALGLSPTTVSSYRKAICRKVGVHSTARLVAYAAALSPLPAAPATGLAPGRSDRLPPDRPRGHLVGRESRLLSPRQTDVIELVAKGLHNTEIGGILGISERTVRGYVGQLFLIFDVSNRTELVGVWLGDQPRPGEPH